jgi:hypothetical protein
MSETTPAPRSESGSNAAKPVPDPTTLTTEQLIREVSAAARLWKAELDGFKDKCNVQFASIAENFERVEAWRKEQKIDTKVAVDAALAAAEKAVRDQTLTSEKSAAKSETAFAEQSKQQNATFTASLKGVSDTLADVKDRFLKVESVALQVTALIESVNALRDRVQSIESQKTGASETRTERRSETGSLLAIVGGFFGLVGLVATVISVAILLSR